MSKQNDKTGKPSQGTGDFFLEQLPSNIPFVPGIKRPDYQLRKVRLSIPKRIPESIIVVLILTGILFVLMGGFFITSGNDITSFGVDKNGDPVVVLQDLGSQFLYEGIAAGLLMFIGSAGLYLIYYSALNAYHSKQATIALIVGIGIALATSIAVMYLLMTKLELI